MTEIMTHNVQRVFEHPSNGDQYSTAVNTMARLWKFEGIDSKGTRFQDHVAAPARNCEARKEPDGWYWYWDEEEEEETKASPPLRPGVDLPRSHINYYKAERRTDTRWAFYELEDCEVPVTYTCGSPGAAYVSVWRLEAWYWTPKSLGMGLETECVVREDGDVVPLVETNVHLLSSAYSRDDLHKVWKEAARVIEVCNTARRMLWSAFTAVYPGDGKRLMGLPASLTCIGAAKVVRDWEEAYLEFLGEKSLKTTTKPYAGYVPGGNDMPGEG